MNAKEFNYIRSFKKVLKKHVPFNVVEEGESSVRIETEPLCIGQFGTFFEIFVSSEGFFSIQFFPSGRISEENISMLRDICSNVSGKVKNIKLFINEDDFLTVSYDTLLSDSEKLIDRELRNAFGVFNGIYRYILPPVMVAYWRSVNNLDPEEFLSDFDDDDIDEDEDFADFE